MKIQLNYLGHGTAQLCFGHSSRWSFVTMVGYLGDPVLALLTGALDLLNGMDYVERQLDGEPPSARISLTKDGGRVRLRIVAEDASFEVLLDDPEEFGLAVLSFARDVEADRERYQREWTVPHDTPVPFPDAAFESLRLRLVTPHASPP